jgi:hypothetical protein
LAHAPKKGRNEDLARKRLLHLGAEVRDLSGAAAEPERRSKALAGPRQDQSGNEREVRPPPRVSGKGVGQRSILREELGHGPQTQRNSPR